MNEEMSTRLAQELLEAPDEDARARVVVHWLPAFARCQVTTSARVKQLVTTVGELRDEMRAYHAPKDAKEEQPVKPAKPVDPRLERLKLILGFAQRNWQGAALLVILAKAFGLLGDLTLKDLLHFLN